jgi:hypothetical protein
MDVGLVRKLAGKNGVVDVDVLERVFAIREEVAVNYRQRDKHTKDFKTRITKYDETLREIQSRCQHEATTHFGDPSGNADSHTTCDICGGDIQ